MRKLCAKKKRTIFAIVLIHILVRKDFAKKIKSQAAKKRKPQCTERT